MDPEKKLKCFYIQVVSPWKMDSGMPNVYYLNKMSKEQLKHNADYY